MTGWIAHTHTLVLCRHHHGSVDLALGANYDCTLGVSSKKAQVVNVKHYRTLKERRCRRVRFGSGAKKLGADVETSAGNFHQLSLR